MWPFERKPKESGAAFWVTEPLPGITRLADSSLQISLTDEEEQAVQRHLNQIHTYATEESGGAEVRVHPELARVLEAQGLWSYAQDVIKPLQFDGPAIPTTADLSKGIAALTKAYSLCSYPILLKDLGDAFRIAGKGLMANRLDHEFSANSLRFQTSQLYQMFLDWRKAILRT